MPLNSAYVECFDFRSDGPVYVKCWFPSVKKILYMVLKNYLVIYMDNLDGIFCNAMWTLSRNLMSSRGGTPKLKQKSIGKTAVESCSGLQWNVEFYSVIKFSTNPLSYTPLKHYATLSHHALTLSEWQLTLNFNFVTF